MAQSFPFKNRIVGYNIYSDNKVTPHDNNGKTPLDLAEEYGHTEICQLLRTKMMRKD